MFIGGGKKVGSSEGFFVLNALCKQYLLFLSSVAQIRESCMFGSKEIF